MPSQQKTFTTVVTTLLKQGKPARDGLQCVYRATDGSKCAVGQLIPDKLYNPEMEGEGLRGRPAIAQILHDHDLQLLYALQDSHDACTSDETFVEDFTAEARGLAERFNLEMPNVPTR